MSAMRVELRRGPQRLCEVSDGGFTLDGPTIRLYCYDSSGQHFDRFLCHLRPGETADFREIDDNFVRIQLDE